MVPRMAKARIGILALLLSVATAGSNGNAQTATAPERDGGTELERLLRLFETGDQGAYERFIGSNFDSEALAATDAAERADRLARLFVDSGGFRITGPGRSVADAQTARAVGRLTGLPYCLTLGTRNRDGHVSISDFSAVELPLPVAPQLGPPGPREVARTMTRFMDRLARADTFSGVILIARNGRPFLRRAYGPKSLVPGERNDVNTRFSIASIGKSLTAVVIGQLLDEGRLQLEDQVGRHLPDYPDAAVRDTVTIRQLLSHTSGLGPASDFTNSAAWPSARATIRTIGGYGALITGHPLESPPGSRYSYSNAGYVILGLVIEKITGQSFYDAVEQRVFARAGMAHSFYRDAGSRANVARGLTNFMPVGNDYMFRLGPKRDTQAEFAPIAGSHGGAYVTADDLLRFMNAVRAARLTSAATASLLTTPQSFGRAPDNRTGLGFETVFQNGHAILGHTGGDLGISAFVYHFTQTAYTVIVLSNYDPRAIRVISREVRGLLTRVPIGQPTPAPESNC